jgi:hypothetical protein
VLLVTFDILFPLTLALFFCAWLGDRLRWLPWTTRALDYAENVACGVLVATFPNESARVASLAGVLTAAKFVGYAACLAALLSVAARPTISAIRHLREGGQPVDRIDVITARTTAQ